MIYDAAGKTTVMRGACFMQLKVARGFADGPLKQDTSAHALHDCFCHFSTVSIWCAFPSGKTDGVTDCGKTTSH
jgi:hypothetical protein